MSVDFRYDIPTIYDKEMMFSRLYLNFVKLAKKHRNIRV